MDLGRFKAGDVSHLHDGSRVEALAPSEDGRSVRVRYRDAPWLKRIWRCRVWNSSG